MSTYAPPVHVHHRPHVDLRLGAVIAVVAALLALGSWVLVDRYTGGGATQATTTYQQALSKAFSSSLPSYLYPTTTYEQALSRAFSSSLPSFLYPSTTYEQAVANAFPSHLPALP